MSRSGGFTTVELLVTLFVASLFVLSGYQFYGAVSSRTVAARSMAEASNIGHEVLAKAGEYRTITVLCTAAASTHSTTNINLSSLGITSTTLPDATARVLRCKPSSSSPIIRVTAIVGYGSPVKEVAHAKYVAE